MKKQAGFTLIELVAVMVILALLGAMAVPRFADVQSSAVEAVLDGTKNAVKSAHSIGIARDRDFPSNDDLVGLVGGETPLTAQAKGLDFTVSGTSYTVQTFTDASCLAQPTATTDKIRCVGSVLETALVP